MSQHNCDSITDEPDGFWVMTCACGFTTPPCPDIDIAVDEMMAHAVESDIG